MLSGSLSARESWSFAMPGTLEGCAADEHWPLVWHGFPSHHTTRLSEPPLPLKLVSVPTSMNCLHSSYSSLEPSVK